MYILTLFLLLPLTLTSSLPPQVDYLFRNPPSHNQNTSNYTIPTSRESAVLARRILALTPLGVLSTIFPSTHTPLSHPQPPTVSGDPIGLMDYISDCETPSVGHPTILAINVATSFRNVAAGSNISLSLRWTPPYPPKERIELSYYIPFFNGKGRRKEAVPYSAANLPRFSLQGHIEKISDEEAEEQDLGKCFTDAHPDARYWLPGNSIHESEWVRLVVREVYWIGGFGDRAYIGWIPVEEWRDVNREEWKSVRIPGERRGWKEWSWGGGDWEL